MAITGSRACGPCRSRTESWQGLGLAPTADDKKAPSADGAMLNRQSHPAIPSPGSCREAVRERFMPLPGIDPGKDIWVVGDADPYPILSIRLGCGCRGRRPRRPLEPGVTLWGIVLLPPFFNFGADCRPVWVGLTSLLLNDKSEAKSVLGAFLPQPPPLRGLHFGIR